MASIAPEDLLDRIDRGVAPVILDVRSAQEFQAGHLPGAVNIPFSSIAAGGEIPAAPGDDIVLYCGHGPRAWIAGAALRWRGLTGITYLRGHWARWRRAGHPVVT